MDFLQPPVPAPLKAPRRPAALAPGVRIQGHYIERASTTRRVPAVIRLGPFSLGEWLSAVAVPISVGGVLMILVLRECGEGPLLGGV